MISFAKYKKNLIKKSRMIGFIVVVILLAISAVLFIQMFSTPHIESERITPPLDALYRQSSVPTEQRIEDLLAWMSLEEKVGQMALVEKYSIRDVDDISAYGLGALLSGFGGKPENNTREGWDEMVTQFMDASRESRLGIPILYGVDAIHGHSNVPGATVFPHAIGLGATRDQELVWEVAAATAEEMTATNIRWSFSPTLDLPRDIRWGRVFEAFSDDPELVADLGNAYITGLQSKRTASDSGNVFVLSTPKHYIGAGSMVWGSSSGKDYQIDQGTTLPDEAALRREYLPPFAAAVDTGVMGIMVGLNSWGSTKLSAETYLITDVLKAELGYEGFVVSDWYGVYEIPGSDYHAAVTAINAGVDMVMLPFDYEPFVRNVVRAVRNGDIAPARIDDAVRRILRAKFALGLFDEERIEISHEVIGSAEHRALAREAVAKSLVLLKNEGSVLPIRNNVQHIRVAGSSANNVGRQAGGWTVEWEGIDGNWLPGSTSILEGIRARAGNGVRIEYNALGNFSTSDERADLGIAVVGEKPYAEGWGDREFPVLDPEDLDAILKLQSVSRNIVVVLVSGRPLLVSNEIDSWDAVVAAWLPGSEGAGVADVLFGDRPFTGTLPLPWPRYSQQLPITPDGVTADGTLPLFPRYFGL